MTVIHALERGIAAEYLVCADLILAGYRAFPTDQGVPYDIVADVGNRLIRIQVKSTQKPRPVPERPGSGPSYMFHCRRAGKRGQRKVENDAFDMLALVALDTREIAYLSINDRILQTIHLRTSGSEGSHGNRSRKNINQYPFEAALCDILGFQ